MFLLIPFPLSSSCRPRGCIYGVHTPPPSQITINSSLNLSCSELHLEKKKRREKIPRLCPFVSRDLASGKSFTKELKSMRKDTRRFPPSFLIPSSISISFALSFATDFQKFFPRLISRRLINPLLRSSRVVDEI